MTHTRRSSRWLPALLGSLALTAGSSAQTIDTTKVSATEGGIEMGIDAGDRFGCVVASLGDLDGDGVGDVAVGAPLDDGSGPDRGAVWVLFLNDDGSVRARQKVNSTQGGLVGPIGDLDRFGTSLACIGDLDGDGVSDLVVGCRKDDDGDTNAGALYVLLLQSNGSVKAEQKISNLAGGFTGQLDKFDNFGASVAYLGDLDRDGVPDVAVGAPKDDDGFEDTGAVWILFLNDDGTVKAHQKISAIEGGFNGELDASDRFGTALSYERQLELLAVGAPQDDGVHDDEPDRGTVWIMPLRSDGTAAEAQRLGDGLAVERQDLFGDALAFLDRLDGFAGALAVGAPRDDDGGQDRGAVWLLSSDDFEEVDYARKLSATAGGFDGTLDDGDGLGAALAPLGDLDDNSVPELLVGAPFDDDGGDEAGAVWTLFLGGLASSERRSPTQVFVRPDSFVAHSLPILGEDWVTEVRHDRPGERGSTFVLSYEDFLEPGIKVPGGELLVDTLSELYIEDCRPFPMVGDTTLHASTMPNDVMLLGLPFYAQAGVLLPDSVELYDSLDLVLGY